MVDDGSSDDTEHESSLSARDMELVHYVTSGGTLCMYLLSGKKKHERVFWVEPHGKLSLSWDKKRPAPNKQPKKSERLRGVQPSIPAFRTARPQECDIFLSEKSLTERD